MKNWRPDNWENPFIAKIKEVSNEPIQPMALFSWREMAIEAKKHYEAGAILKEIALKLQAIYNLPDEGMFHKKMGEFIEKLMEEIG